MMMSPKQIGTSHLDLVADEIRFVLHHRLLVAVVVAVVAVVAIAVEAGTDVGEKEEKKENEREPE